MSKTTASAAGGAMPEGHRTLADLIEAHRAAAATFSKMVDALEAAEPDGNILIPCVAREPVAVESRCREDLINVIEENFNFEVDKKLNRLMELSPEFGAAARAVLEKERDRCRARLEEIFADYMAVEDVWQKARDAEEDVLLAICAHRCASMEEIAIKVRYLAGLGSMLEPLQSAAFYLSFLQEGEQVEPFM